MSALRIPAPFGSVRKLPAPFAVILSIPFGPAGSFIFARMFGISNNIYLQIALIMLIGLLAKNAILIVEFALERRMTGMSVVNAAIAGAGARLRPILMTSLAMVIGLLPMMFAHGVGANGNRALGAGSVGGMLIGMICRFSSFRHCSAYSSSFREVPSYPVAERRKRRHNRKRNRTIRSII